MEELSEETRDETLRRQINERLDYEKKAFEIFIHNQTGKSVYVVENMEYESCGFFIDYNRALKYAKKICGQMICYKLTESGIWSHEHINPLYLEVEFPTYIEDDSKRQALRYATEALGDYLSHKSNGKEFCPDLVLKYARKYAEVCRKKSLSEKMLEEAKKPEDIML